MNGDMIFLPECESRLNLIRGGRKGGKKSRKNKPIGKPISKPTLKPIGKPTPKQSKREKKLKEKVKENAGEHVIDPYVLEKAVSQVSKAFSSEEKVELINGTSEESFPILVKKAMTKFILQNGWAEKTGFSKKRQTENLKKWVERWAHHIRDDRQYVPPSMEKSLQQVVAIFDENALKPSTPSEFDSCKSRISHLLRRPLAGLFSLSLARPQVEGVRLLWDT